MVTKDLWLDWKNPNEDREINQKNLKRCPSLETGDWWDNPEDLIKVMKDVKKK